jgi:hypothetical protein
MADFSIVFRSSDYQTERGQLIRAKRAYLLCEFASLPVVCDAFLDTAAPFSVIPYSLSRQVIWERLASRLTPVGSGAAAALLWQGIPCDLGLITLRCVDYSAGLRSHFLQTLAKFPQQPAVPSLERTVVLGMSLLDGNDVRLLLERFGPTLAGLLSIP